ncbi:MAG: chorismate synthase [Lachnospiraceae bacterium]|nr:chorismate synthase [Lachnospiraceae bacterium]
MDGLTPGITVDEDRIGYMLKKRRPYGSISTGRVEQDPYEIVSGVFQGKTTGTPLCFLIPNQQQDSTVYEENRGPARPGHADYTAFMKYHGFEDFRGGGHFSGRLTAALTAAGALVMSALEEKGIYIGTHIKKLGQVEDRNFQEVCIHEEENAQQTPEKTDIFEALKEDIAYLYSQRFPVLDKKKAALMQEEILKAKEALDSVGGILETAVCGLPAGLGEPWFDTAEGVLSQALFSIPGVKGVEFGDAFALSSGYGSEYNDRFVQINGQTLTKTNRNGGVNGGIMNGMPVVFRTAVKPTPTIGKAQETVDFIKEENTVISGKGRHDPAIIHRAAVVQDAVTALVIYDMMAVRYGTDWAGDLC